MYVSIRFVRKARCKGFALVAAIVAISALGAGASRAAGDAAKGRAAFVR
jgi:hypothetical protein